MYTARAFAVTALNVIYRPTKAHRMAWCIFTLAKDKYIRIA